MFTQQIEESRQSLYTLADRNFLEGNMQMYVMSVLLNKVSVFALRQFKVDIKAI